jgi:serine protease DegQ
MKKYWLIFSQSVTVCLGVIFVLNLFYPRLMTNTGQALNANLSSADSPDKIGYSQAVMKAMPSVVSIFTRKAVDVDENQTYRDDPLLKRFFNDGSHEKPQHEISLGSGVIIRDNGLIVTNAHVVAGAEEIQVSLSDGRITDARIVGKDPETDLALLKIELNHLPVISFANPTQNHVGNIVLAIGNPFGVGQTVTQGIVSALGRNHLGISTYENFIQTDASINPGNSGGALIDTDGNLVGINSAIYSRNGGSMGIGFAIPVKIVKEVTEQIVRQGSVTRGWIGIEVEDMDSQLADTYQIKETEGALITRILKGGPADLASLRPGDVLKAINGHTVHDSGDMLNQISALKPNQPAELLISRHQQDIKIPIIVGKRPSVALLKKEFNHH